MEVMNFIKNNLFFFFLLLTQVLFSQNEQIKIDSSGVITIKSKENKYLDVNNWSCIIQDEKEIYNTNKKSKHNQKQINFLFPYDFKTTQKESKKYNIIIEKNKKIIYNQAVFFDVKSEGKYQLYNYQFDISNEQIKGEILDVYFCESKDKEHLILRSIYKSKRIYFYYFINKELVNIHTDNINFYDLNKIKKPIIITDLNNDLKPEISCKYNTLSTEKIVLFNENNKYICRRTKEEITFSNALNYHQNILFKQHLINEILKKSE